MKGHVSTSVLLKAVLNKEWGLRTGNVLSHAAAFEVEGFEKLVFVTDAAMNISPDLGQKAQIIQNTVSVARSIGIDQPKVAPLAAVEVINPQMQATLDAAALTVMNQRDKSKIAWWTGRLHSITPFHRLRRDKKELSARWPEKRISSWCLL